uniref:KIAA1614 n=1 Tax=Mandrillus leucophaeus TaxID=9568 RepID=A0A2K5YHQ1_MANLE
MEGTEAAAAKPAGSSPQGPKTGSGRASPMEGTSAVEWRGLESQMDNGHPPRPWPCPQENRTSSPMAPRPPRVWGVQLQGPSVLESKVRALKEKMTAAKQGVSPCSASHERSSPKKPKCRRDKAGGAGTSSEGPFLPSTVVAPHTQNLPDGQLDGGINEEEPARDGGPGPPRPPAPGREYCNRGSPWPPEAEWTLPDHERGPLLGPSSLQESPIHGITPGRPGDPGPCNKIIHIPSPRTGRSSPFPDGVVTDADLDSTSLTSEEESVPGTALLGERWRAGDLEALGTGSSALSLSDRVERNRLLLQEMLSVSGQSPRKAGTPAQTPSWDTAAPERPVGDVDWALGTSLQDSGQNRTVGPKPEPVLSPRHEEATHLLQRARMKARTRPLRASHDIVPTITQGRATTSGFHLTFLSTPGCQFLAPNVPEALVLAHLRPSRWPQGTVCPGHPPGPPLPPHLHPCVSEHQQGPGDQGEPVGIPRPPSRSTILRTCELPPSQTQPSCPQVRHPLLALSTNNCNNSAPRGLQEPYGGAVHEGRVERGPCSREPELPLENSRDGGPQGFPGSADVATINSTGITLSLSSEEPESSQESEGSLQRTGSGSGGHVLSRASAGADTGPGSPLAAPLDQNKKRSSSIASTLGLKKLFSALGQSSRPKLGKSRSYSVEQLQPAVPGLASHSRAPSLQSLHPVSPSHQRRKAASFQNLHSLLSGKGERSRLYLVAGPGDHSAAGRPAKASPRRALSVEDVGAPSLARTVGRLVEVFPDGTSQLQLQRSPGGTFGFCVASGNGRPDSGMPSPLPQPHSRGSLSKPRQGLLAVSEAFLVLG